MTESKNKIHWENIYETKNSSQVSWTQDVPKTSLEIIQSFGMDKTARIIDVGGGDSKLVDYLLEIGYEDVTVLDISAKAIQKAKDRLGENAEKVKWIVRDVNEFEPDRPFDIWHDRATFHFLTASEQISRYLDLARGNICGYMVIGTFSTNGPTECSGLAIKQYDEQSLATILGSGFDKLTCITEDHLTPFGTRQNFLFCSFRRKLKISV